MLVAVLMDLARDHAVQFALAQGKKVVGLDSVSNAIRATCKELDDERLSVPLRAWLDSDDFTAFVKMEITGASDDAVVASFVSVLRHTTYSAADEYEGRRILSSFFAALRAALLRGPDAVATVEAFADVRHQQTVAIARENQAELLQRFAYLSEQISGIQPSSSAADPKESDARAALRSAQSLFKARQAPAAAIVLDSISNLEDLPIALQTDVAMLRGVAALRSGDTATARGQFETALAHSPEHAGPLTNLSIVYSREGRHREALDHAQRARDLKPDHHGIRANYALALLRAGEEERALTVMGNPSDWPDDLELLVTAAQVYSNMQRYQSMEEVARGAVAIDSENPEALLLLGTAIMGQSDDLLHRPPEARVREALDLFTKVLQLSENINELAEERVIAWTNRAAAFGHMGESDAGIADCIAALAADPEAHQARRNLALFYLEDGRNDLAKPQLAKLKGTEADDSARILLARVALREDRPRAALEELQPLITAQASGDRFGAAAELALEAYKRLPDDVTGREFLNRLEELAESDANISAIIAIHASAEQFSSAVERLNGAIAQAPESERARLVIALADLYYYSRRFDEAALLYDSNVDESFDLDVLRRHVISQFNSGNWRAAASWAERIRLAAGALPTITEIEANVWELVGEVEKARELFGALYTRYGDVKFRLRSIAALARRAPDEARAEVLEISGDQLSSAADLIVAGAIRQELGAPGALEFFFKALDLDFASEETQLAYMRCYLMVGDDEISEVVPECEVVLSHGDQSFTWELVADPSGVQRSSQFAATRPPGSLLVGLSVGETVQWPSGRFLTVDEIRSKYSARFARIFNEFHHRFPESRHMRFGDHADELLEEIKAGGRRAEAVRGLYRRGILGLGGVAELTNRSPMEIWAFMFFNPAERLLASSGEPGARESWESLFTGVENLTLDQSALCTLTELGVIDVLPRVFKKILVSQQVYEDLTELLRHEERPNRDGMIISSDGAEVHLEDASETRRHARAEYLQRVVTAMRAVSERVGSGSLADLPRSVRDAAGQRVGSVSLSSIAAAASEKSLLCTDDLVAQTVAREHFKVQSVPTLALLDYLSRIGAIDLETTRLAIRRLIEARYVFVATTAQELFDVMSDRSFSPTAKVMVHLRTLHGPDCDEAAAAEVLADLIRLIWLNATEFTRHSMVDVAANTMATGRDPFRALTRLRRAVQQRFVLMPAQGLEIDASLSAWQRRTELL